MRPFFQKKFLFFPSMASGRKGEHNILWGQVSTFPKAEKVPKNKKKIEKNACIPRSVLLQCSRCADNASFLWRDLSSGREVAGMPSG